MELERLTKLEDIRTMVDISEVVDSYAQLKLEHEELKEKLANVFQQVDEVMKCQANMQAIVNRGLNLKHPKQFECSDREEAVKFEKNQT